jgi:hypothetical protein
VYTTAGARTDVLSPVFATVDGGSSTKSACAVPNGVNIFGISMYDADWEEFADSYVKNLQKIEPNVTMPVYGYTINRKKQSMCLFTDEISMHAAQHSSSRHRYRKHHEKMVLGKSEDPWSTIRSDGPYFGTPWASRAEKVWNTTDQLFPIRKSFNSSHKVSWTCSTEIRGT